MNTGKIGYWRRLWRVLRGRAVPPAVAAAPLDERLAERQARITALEMELAERDQQIERMRSEYAALQADKERVSAGAGQDQLEKLFKKLAGPLANLAVLTATAEAGREIEVGDLIQLIRSLEKELARAGLEPLGTVGEKTVFDVACHQRMSGGAVRAGVPVTVQIPGYRMGEKILVKAMVSAGEDKPPSTSAFPG